MTVNSYRKNIISSRAVKLNICIKFDGTFACDRVSTLFGSDFGGKKGQARRRTLGKSDLHPLRFANLNKNARSPYRRLSSSRNTLTGGESREAR